VEEGKRSGGSKARNSKHPEGDRKLSKEKAVLGLASVVRETKNFFIEKRRGMGPRDGSGGSSGLQA